MATINSIGSSKPVEVAFGGTGAATLTDGGVLVGSGTGAFTSLTVGTNGQVLLGSTGADPVFATLTSTGSTITYTPGAGTLNIDSTDASEAQKGAVELATDAEAIAGSDTARAIVPSSLVAKLGTQTDHGLLVGSGTSAAVTALAEASNGQLPIGSTGADPVLATLTAGDAMSITNAAGSITIDNILAVNAQTGTTYTLVLADGGKLVTLTNASAITLTVPTNASVAFPIGTQILLYQGGAGQVTVSSSATVRSEGTKLKLNAQYSVAALVKIATDEWILGGDRTA